MSFRPSEPFRLPTALAISLLWAALMGLYIYNDYFSLYMPGTIDGMRAGRLGPLGPATEWVLVGVATLLAIPALMIFLSAALPRAVSRWLNVGLGLAYTGVQGTTFFGSALFYQVVVVLEILVTLTIVAYALRWPRETAATEPLS